MDHRALNAITSKDQFPIPAINELLDELYGTPLVSEVGFPFRVSSRALKILSHALQALQCISGISGYHEPHFLVVSASFRHHFLTTSSEQNNESNKAFEALKHGMYDAPVLALPNFQGVVWELDFGGEDFGGLHLYLEIQIQWYSSSFRKVTKKYFFGKVCAMMWLSSYANVCLHLSADETCKPCSLQLASTTADS